MTTPRNFSVVSALNSSPKQTELPLLELCLTPWPLLGNIDCNIVGASSTVNCRECASTTCDVVTTFKVGSTHSFKCAVKGQCVTINGVTNW